MAVVSSPVDVCNLAQDHVGQPPIASISPPGTDAEILIARNYDKNRRQLLRKGVWNFAKKRVLLSRDAAAPEFDYADRYLLPADYIRFLSVGGYSEKDQSKLFDISERYVLINNDGSASLKLRYIADITDVSKWDDLFINLLALYIARDIAYPLTKDEAVVKRINELISIETPDAFGTDGQERPPVRIQRSKWLDARRTGVISPGYYVDFEE